MHLAPINRKSHSSVAVPTHYAFAGTVPGHAAGKRFRSKARLLAHSTRASVSGDVACAAERRRRS